MMQPEDIDIWKIPLELPEQAVYRLEKSLNSEEREKANRFHFAKDRRGYIIARGALRAILARYLQVNPEMLAFSYGKYGKPFLAAPPPANRLKFNLSHCADLALIAVTCNRPVGIDVEKERYIPEMEQIASRYFSPMEQDYVRSFPEEKRNIAFLRIWTRREAIVKAAGMDLQAALGIQDLPLCNPAIVTSCKVASCVTPDTDKQGSGWLLKDLDLNLPHIGSICTSGNNITLDYFNFEYLENVY